MAKKIERTQLVPGVPITHASIKAIIKWKTIGGNEYEGVIVDLDSNVAIVKCTDGKTRSVEIGRR
jgi:hypothetical protein